LTKRSVRILTAYATKYDYDLRHHDIDNAFHNGIVHHDIYMLQPAGYEKTNPVNKDKLTLTAYTDSSYADQSERKSTLAYVTLIDGGPMHWKTKRSKAQALSTTEAELMAMSLCAREIADDRNVLDSVHQTQLEPTLMYGDNQAALKMNQMKTLNFVHEIMLKQFRTLNQYSNILMSI